MPQQGRGRPRTRLARVRADKAYDSRRNRSYLRRRDIKATIPVLRTVSTTAASSARAEASWIRWSRPSSHHRVK